MITKQLYSALLIEVASSGQFAQNKSSVVSFQERSDVIGHLDGLRGMKIVGWAFDADAPCQISAIDDNGVTLADGFAFLERSDLLCLGQSRCDFAFSLPLNINDASTLIHVLANGKEIANSPLPIGSGHFDGHFETRQGLVEGWVMERKIDGRSPLVTITDQDGTIVFESRSNAEAPATSDDGTPSRFVGKLSLQCFGAGERCLSAFADGVKFAEASCNLVLQGNVEALSQDRCTGWLLSTDAPAQPFEFEILRDGELIAKARCNLDRSDVQTMFPGIRKSGFSCILPPATTSILDFTTISLRFAASARELFDGPFVLASRPAVIQAARTASRLGVSLSDSASERAVHVVLQSAIHNFISKSREADNIVFRKNFSLHAARATRPRLSIVIPIYRGIEITRACIDSVLQVRSSSDDRVILVHDHSPETGMSRMLQGYLRQPNLFLLNNESNLGFIRSVNRALSFTRSEDVVLLNSDTRVFKGAFDCLWRAAHSSIDIGTVTAMSNNATIFSYPHYSLRRDELDDISWQELAAVALRVNGEMIVDVPSGHGFCMLIKRSVLDRFPNLDESFGRGYGEENDLCARAADIGFRNVAATGVLVQHKESTSFLSEKNDLLTTNLARLESRYPEYTPTVIEVERRDDLRVARWALDQQRLRLASNTGSRFALIVSHRLGGGTNKAMADIERLVGYGEAKKLNLSCRPDGYLEIECDAPLLHAVFSPAEAVPLSKFLSSANITLVVVHQLLGFSIGIFKSLKVILKGIQSVFYAHDFYAFCPRVTMIDATNQFCNQASVDVCSRCIKLGGSHPSSRLSSLTPSQHRAMFSGLLQSFTHVVTPSANAASYFGIAFPNLRVNPLPHPDEVSRSSMLRASGNHVVLFGALGAHKGSAKLLEIAQLARLTSPNLRFTVVGYTNIDDELQQLGNVTITGAYAADSLASLVKTIAGRIALFLSTWPETYSYTLSEAIAHGFFPLVPDIGALAERVRLANFGAVFPFPIIASQVLEFISQLQDDIPMTELDGYASTNTAMNDTIERTRKLFALHDSLS